MISKIVFLLSLSAALSFHLKFTPAELKVLFEDIFDDIANDKQHEAKIEIRATIVPLETADNNFFYSTNEDLKEASKPFWDFVKSAEEDAESKGQDVSKCIDLADQKLFDLNETYAAPLFAKKKFWIDTGYDTIDTAAAEADSVTDELVVLHTVVTDCNDDDCATELQYTVLEFHQRALDTLNDAVGKARSVVLTYIPYILSFVKLDQVAYQQEAAEIIDDAKNCINNL